MKRILLAVLMVTVTSTAWAEWVLIASGSPSGSLISVYADPTTIRRGGGRAKMWSRFDVKNRKLYQKDEYDCKDKRSRNIYYTVRSGRMDAGATVYSSDGMPKSKTKITSETIKSWTPVATGGFDETLWKRACGKK